MQFNGNELGEGKAEIFECADLTTACVLLPVDRHFVNFIKFICLERIFYASRDMCR